MTRILLFACLMCLAGCSNKPSGEPVPTNSGVTPVTTESTSTTPTKPSATPPAFQVTAKALSEEASRDKRATTAKYGDKVIELTGPFDHISVDRIFGGVSLSLLGSKDKPDSDYRTVECAFSDEQFQSVLKKHPLARGQLVTVRGKCHWQSAESLQACELVKVGPSTAVPMTLKQLESDYSSEGGLAKLEGKDVLVLVKLQGTKPNKANLNDATWSLVPPMGSGRRFTIEFPFLMNEAYRRDLAEPNPGDSILILAQVRKIDAKDVVLSETRLAAGVPLELTLPDEK